MRPVEILDAQADLMTRLESEKFRNLCSGMLPRGWDFMPKLTQKEFFDHLQLQVRMAYAYRVSADMCDLVQYAAEKLEEDDLWDYQQAPTEYGFVRFDRPIPIHDVRGKVMHLSWMIWGKAGFLLKQTGVNQPATVLWQFSDCRTDPDEVDLEITKDLTSVELERVDLIRGRWSSVGMTIAEQGQPIGQPLLPTDPEGTREYLKGMGEDPDSVVPMPTTNVKRILCALWLLLNQTIVVVEKEEPDRAGRRRAARHKLPPQVSVIRLRRSESRYQPKEGESQVEWQHRWMVRGHWRWQACGPNRQDRVRIWINPFIKGPEDKPFHQTEKLYSLDR